MKKTEFFLRSTLLAASLSAILLPAAASAEGTQASSQPYVWKNVKVVAGGFIPGIIFNTKQPGLVYCRTDIGSSYKWDNPAKKWIPLTDWCGDGNLHGSESLATDPVDPNRLYIAAGMYARDPAAILRSMDQGRTFQIINVPFRMGGNELGRSVGERLAIDPNDNNILYFGSRHDGLWVSTNTALNWSKVDSFPITVSDAQGGRGGGVGLSFVVFDAGSGTAGKPTPVIYVGSTESGDAHLFRSGDAGKNWEAVAGQPTNFMAIHAVLDAQGLLYVVYDNGPGPYGVSDGSVWRLNTKDGQWTNITPDKSPNRPPGGYGGIAVDLHRPGTVIVATLNRKTDDDDYRIYQSTDGGENWKDITAKTHRDASASPYVVWVGKPMGPDPVHPEASVGWWMATLAMDPFDSKHVCYATGATVWNSTDFDNVDADQDTHWFIWADGIEETAVMDLASPPAGVHLISAFGDIGGFTHEDVDVSPKNGMHLHPLFTTTSSLDFAEKNPDIVIRTGARALHIPDRDTMAYSLDGGHTWKPFTLGATAGGGRLVGDGGDGAQGGGVGSGPVILSADGSVFMSTAGTVQISTNRGGSWMNVQGLPQGARPVADRANPAKFYAMSAAGGKIFRSTDGGATFTTNDVTGLPAGGGGGRAGGARLIAVPDREGDLWLIGRGALYHSFNGGASFKPITDPPSMSTLAFGKAAPGKDYPALFIAGSYHGQQGVFRSDDMATTWVRVNDDQHQWGNRFRCIAGDPRIYGRVYVGTDGRGILYGDIAN